MNYIIFLIMMTMAQIYPPPSTPIPIPTSTPSPNQYLVGGRILFQGKPPISSNFDVGLCEITRDGNICAYSVVPPAPKSKLDENGYYTIENVPPGNYGLVFDFSYFLQIMPWHPADDKEILFTVTDRNYNLGILNWSDIPCDIIYDWRCGNMLALPVIGVE